MKRLLVMCALAGVAACLMAAASSASSPGALSVSPSSPLVGDALVFAGCGYAPGVLVTVQAVHNTKAATDIFQDGVTTDGSGCFSTAAAPYVAPDSGKWTAGVFESGHKDATLIFTVG